MNNAVNFILESGISLSLLSAIYLLFLRRETFFRMNRWFLLGSLGFSVVLPFLKFRIYEPAPTMLPEIIVTPYRNLLEAVTVYGHGFTGNVEQAIITTKLLIIIYFAGVGVFFARFLFRIIQILLLVNKNEVQLADGFKLVILDKDFSPFSFLNYVFVSRASQKSNGYDRMIAHEVEHVRQGHSFDVIILEFLTVLQWFNPFMWLLRKAIRENHEFLADQAVLKSGVNPVYYKHLLISQVVGFQLDMANNFNSSLIKTRIKMITKIKSSKYGQLKLLMGLLVIFGLVTAFAFEEKTTKKIKEKNLILSLDEQVFRSTEDLNFITEVMNSKLSIEKKKEKLQEKYTLDFRYGVYGVRWKRNPENAIYFLDGKEISYAESKQLLEEKKIKTTISTLPQNGMEYDVFYEKYGDRVKNGISLQYMNIELPMLIPASSNTQEPVVKPTIESYLDKHYKTRLAEYKLKKNQVSVIANDKKFIVTGEDVTMKDVANLLKDGKFDYSITGDRTITVKHIEDQPRTEILKIQSDNNNTPGKQVFFIVEDMPEFPGGELALRKHIAEAIKYPVEAQKKGVQGKVYVTFVVDSEGNVTDAKIARGVDVSLDAEAVRVVNSLPKWIPGKQKGVPVAVSYTVPINFVLK